MIYSMRNHFKWPCVFLLDGNVANAISVDRQAASFAELKRPFTDEFLTALYDHYDL
jgi:hypothetical protein